MQTATKIRICESIYCNNEIGEHRARNAKTCSTHCSLSRKREINARDKRKRERQKHIKRMEMLESLASHKNILKKQTPVKIKSNVDGVYGVMIAYPLNTDPNSFSLYRYRGTWRLCLYNRVIQQRSRQRWQEDGIMPMVKIIGLDLEDS